MMDNTMKTPPVKSELWRAFSGSCVVAGALCIVGAAMAAGAEVASEPLPEGAIKVEEGVYQVPIGRDDAGCMMYRMHAPGRDVVQVIFYRRADGAFTMSKSDAVCGKDDPKR